MCDLFREEFLLPLSMQLALRIAPNPERLATYGSEGANELGMSGSCLVWDAFKVEDKGRKDFAVVLLPLPDALNRLGCTSTRPVNSLLLCFLLYFLCLSVLGFQKSTLESSGLCVARSLAEHTGFGLLKRMLLGRRSRREMASIAIGCSLDRWLLVIADILLIKMLSWSFEYWGARFPEGRVDCIGHAAERSSAIGHDAELILCR